MKQREKVAREGEEMRVEKAAYTPPKLIEFGPVGALTQSGTGNMAENVLVMMGIPSCQPSSMRSMC